MTTPSWLQDSNVLTYAAEHLPVVRVMDNTPVVIMPGKDGDWSIRNLAFKDERAAWKRLYEPFVGRLGEALESLDGFYYLTSCAQCSLPNPVPHTEHGGMPPELVPCGEITKAVAGMRIRFPDATPQEIMKVPPIPAALIFHLRERPCDANVQVDTVCPDCNDTGTIPERIHVEVREGEK